MAWSLRSFLMFICYLIAVSHTQVGTKHLCTHVNLHTHHAANAYMHALADSQWLACEQVYNQVDLMAAMQEGLSARSAMVAEGGRKILQLLNDSHEKLRVGRASPEWRAYSDWIAGLVIDGLRAATTSGLRYMFNQVPVLASAMRSRNAGRISNGFMPHM